MTPFDDEAGIAKLEERLGVLVRQFKALSPGMSDLPLYNRQVSVEAVDFLPFGDTGFGVLLTPWFMNAVFLPLEPVAYDPERIGKVVGVELPAGRRSFTLSGDAEIGLYWSHCIMSPLQQIVSHDAALIVARAKLAELLTLPDQDREEQRPPAERSRRGMMFGDAAGDSAATA